MTQPFGDCGDVTASLGAWVTWAAITADAQAVQTVVDTTLATFCTALGIPQVPTFDVRSQL